MSVNRPPPSTHTLKATRCHAGLVIVPMQWKWLFVMLTYLLSLQMQWSVVIWGWLIHKKPTPSLGAIITLIVVSLYCIYSIWTFKRINLPSHPPHPGKDICMPSLFVLYVCQLCAIIVSKYYKRKVFGLETICRCLSNHVSVYFVRVHLKDACCLHLYRIVLHSSMEHVYACTPPAPPPPHIESCPMSYWIIFCFYAM